MTRSRRSGGKTPPTHINSNPENGLTASSSPPHAGVDNRDRPFKQATLSELLPHLRERALDEFAFSLTRFWDRTSAELKSREAVMTEVGKAIERVFDTRQFDVFLEALYNDGNLRVNHRTLPKLASELKEHFQLPNATVVSGDRADRFAHIAAKTFIREIGRIGKIARDRKTPGKVPEICIGVVSGTTNQMVIETALRMNWLEDCDVNPFDLPIIKVFALNTCPVHPDNIDSNALILASRLAAKLNEGCNRVQRSAKAYGLNVPVFVEKDKMHEVDLAVQTQEVLRYTEPFRVASDSDKAAGIVKPTDTCLDIILTSVGELGDIDTKDGNSGSMFYQLAKQAIPDMRDFVEKTRLVGDLAYNPLSSTGHEVLLHKSTGQQIVFYAAASLEIFASVAANPYKSVILVVQGKQDKKTKILYASLGSGLPASETSRRYVTHLVIDEQTANHLLRY
jgi:hypothetical protein